MNRSILELVAPMKEGEALKKAMEVFPPYEYSIRYEESTTRLIALNDVYDLYIPNEMSVEIYSKLYLAMIKSLQKKFTKLAIRKGNENFKTIKGREGNGIIGGSDSFTIIGESGIGKSSTIQQAIHLLAPKKVIEIQSPFVRIAPCIVVQCPFDCSIKGLLLEILLQLDGLIGSNYYEKMLRARATTDMLIGSVSQICLNHVGLLIVDEIQDVVNHRSGMQLIGALTQLINNSSISICMVGTPRVEQFFESINYLARRTLGLRYSSLEYDNYFKKVCVIGNKDDMSALNPVDVKLAKDIFSEYVEAFQERNPNLVVFNAVLHLDEATPHVHIDYVPVMHNSKRGLRVRNSMKGALAELGFHGESKGSTEWSKWAESEKQVLAGIMKKHGIQWKQLGTHEQHLDVLDYKKKVRLQEVKELDEEIDRKSDTIMQQENLIEEKKQQIESADIVLEISNRQISAAKDELGDIQKQAVTKEQEVKERNQQIKNADTILEKKRIELDSMRNEVKHNQSKLVDVRREMTMEQSELRKVQDSVADYRNELQSLHDKVSYETVELKKVKVEKALALDEIAVTKEETEQLKKEQSDIIVEAEELIDQKARLESAVIEAGKDALSYNNSIAELDGPKWYLQEPAGFVSAKACFKDVALPLVNSLKKWVKSLISYVKVLKVKVKELTEYKSWAEKKIRVQAEAEMKWQQETETLWKDLQDYNLLKIAFGPDRMYELLMEAINIYYKEHGIPYEPVIDAEKNQKSR